MVSGIVQRLRRLCREIDRYFLEWCSEHLVYLGVIKAKPFCAFRSASCWFFCFLIFFSPESYVRHVIALFFSSVPKDYKKFLLDIFILK